MVAPKWTVQTSGTTATGQYNAVWGSGPNDVYVVGNSGTAPPTDSVLLRSNGSGSVWSPQALPTGSGNVLYGIWGSSSSDVYAVGALGSAGVILHSTGSGTWTIQTVGTVPSLQGVWGSGPTDVYVVGQNNTILHSAGDGQWTSLTTTVSAGGYYAIWGSGPNDIYLAGIGLYHFTGSGNPVAVNGQSSNSPPTMAVNGVWGSSATNVYDVGTQGWIGQDSSGIWGSVGNVLSGGASSFFAIAGCSTTDLFAVGFGSSMSNQAADLILHRAASGWQIEWFGDSKTFNTQNALQLFGVWCSTATGEAYAVGSGGTIRYRP